MLPTIIDERKPAPIDLGPTPRILISRLSAIGDCILTWPLATEIKKVWPNSKISWIVDCAVSQLLEKHPAIDEVIRVKKGFVFRPKEIWAIRKQLQERQFDMAIDPQGLAKSGLLTWLSGAPIRLGFDRCQAREGAWMFYTACRHPLSQHLLEKQLELLEMCNLVHPIIDGCGHRAVDFGWDDDLVDAAAVEETMSEMGLRKRQFVLMNPGAGWDSKRWPIDRFAVLAEQLREMTGQPSLVIWGNEREYDFARTVAALAPQSCFVAPNLNLVELAQWCYRASIFVGSDTGPMHLAAAVGTPCMAMFGTTLPQRSGPYGSQHISLQKRYDAGSARYRRKTSNAAMKAIEVDDALQACLTLIRRQQAQLPGLRIAEFSRAAA